MIRWVFRWLAGPWIRRRHRREEAAVLAVLRRQHFRTSAYAVANEVGWATLRVGEALERLVNAGRVERSWPGGVCRYRIRGGR